MKTHIVVLFGAALWCCSNIVGAQTSATEQAVTAPLSFEVFSAPQGINMTRAGALAEALDFKNWPETQTLFTMPEISKTLLKVPALVTESSHSCTGIPFGKTLWDDCNWSWRQLIERKEAQAAKLPDEVRDRIVSGLSEEQRKDSQLVAAHLKRYLERYQKTQRYHLAGQIDIEVCLTPGSRAAKEFMLTKMADNMLPTEILSTTYKAVKPPENPGTIGFITQSRNSDDQQIMFVRNNVFVSIRATGSFVDTTLPLAQKIDDEIISQPSSTLEEIQKHKIK
jgi:hypothetical protein